MTFEEWQRRWAFHLPAECIAELRQALDTPVVGESNAGDVRSEAYVASASKLETSRFGVALWRNNVGVLQDVNGTPVRYGLANQSKAMNEAVKSGDHIGVFPYVVQPKDVGRTLGVFVSAENKRADWRYTGSPRELAQLRWQNLVESLGGVATFVTTSTGVIDRLVSRGLL